MALTTQQQMAANSAAWASSDAATKAQLAAANKALGASIGSTYNAGTGTWTPAATQTPTALTTPVQNAPFTPTVSTDVNAINNINRMNANSLAWYQAQKGDANTSGTKEYLAAQNASIGSQLGATRDASGTWYYNNSPNKLFDTKFAEKPLAPVAEPQYTDMSSMITDHYTNSLKASLGAAQYATDQGVSDLNYAKDQALPGFQESREQSAITTGNNLDNSATRAALQGDRGGIGNRQYGVLQSAGDNRLLEINIAQKSLESNTSREVAKLKAEGKFQEASIIAQNAESQMNALMQEATRIQALAQESYQFGKNYELGSANLTGTFNGKDTLAKTNADRDTALQEADLMGSYKGAPTMAAQQVTIEAATRRLEMGIFTDADAIALGIPASEAKTYAARIRTLADINLSMAKKELALAGSGRGGGSGGSSGSGGSGSIGEKYNYGRAESYILNSSDPQAAYDELISSYNIGRTDVNALKEILADALAGKASDGSGPTGAGPQAGIKPTVPSSSGNIGIVRTLLLKVPTANLRASLLTKAFDNKEISQTELTALRREFGL